MDPGAGDIPSRNVIRNDIGVAGLGDGITTGFPGPFCQSAVSPIRRQDLAGLRRGVYGCLDARVDTLFELTDAALCAQLSLPQLWLGPAYRRGHGGLCDGVIAGRMEFARLRCALPGLALPRVGGRIVPAWTSP